jgi:hypothetical protein
MADIDGIEAHQGGEQADIRLRHALAAQISLA